MTSHTQIWKLSFPNVIIWVGPFTNTKVSLLHITFVSIKNFVNFINTYSISFPLKNLVGQLLPSLLSHLSYA